MVCQEARETRKIDKILECTTKIIVLKLKKTEVTKLEVKQGTENLKKTKTLTKPNNKNIWQILIKIIITKNGIPDKWREAILFFSKGNKRGPNSCRGIN